MILFEDVEFEHTRDWEVSTLEKEGIRLVRKNIILIGFSFI